MYQTCPCHIRLLFSSTTHPAPPCVIHILPPCEFHSTTLPQGQIYLFIFFLLLSTSGILLSSFWQVQVPHTKVPFQCLGVVHWAVKTNFPFKPLPLSSRKSLNVLPACTFVFSDSLCLFFVLSLASVLCTPNFSMDMISSWFPPISFHTFSTTVRYPTVLQFALPSCSPIQRY